MLNLLDESFEEFLRATVPLPKREIDISFSAPDKDWSARISRPTINAYLWDVRRNSSEREAGMEIVHDANGRPHRRPPLPRIDCRYLITAWTTDIRDEHALLGSTLAALLLHVRIESEYLQGAYRDVLPVPSIEIGAGDGRDNSDFWSAVGGQLKPGLDVTLTATVDSAILVPVGPPVERLEIITTPGEADPEQRLFVGGHTEEPAGTLVSTPHGAAEVTEDGTFVVQAEVGDEVTVNGERRTKVGETGEIDVSKRRRKARNPDAGS